MTENEKFYDEEIAPALILLAKKCEERGIPFLASVEYDPGERGRTAFVPDHAGLAMAMLHLCARAGENVDSYIIGLIRYAREHGISTDASIVLNQWRHGQVCPPLHP